jgi:hypothetical protein
LDRFTVTGQNVWTERKQLRSPLTNTKVTAAFGQYAQFELHPVVRPFRNPNLKAPRDTPAPQVEQE